MADGTEAAMPDRAGRDGAVGGRQHRTAADCFASLPETLATASHIGREWIVRRYVHALPPLVLAELERLDAGNRPTGELAYWFLNDDGTFLGIVPGCITPDLAERVRGILFSAVATREDEPEHYRFLVAALASVNRSLRLDVLRHIGGNAPTGILGLLGLAPGQEARFALSTGPGGLALLIDDAIEWPILDAGAGMPDGDGTAVDVVTCFAPLLMLGLRHADGGRSTLVLDPDCRRIDGKDLAHPQTIAVLRQRGPALIRRHWRQIVSLEDTVLGYAPPPVMQLGEESLRRLLYRIRDLVAPAIPDQMLSDPQAPVVLAPAPGYPDGLVLPEIHLRHALGHSLYQAGVEAVRRGGRLCWPSPVDGSPAELEAVFAPQEYTIIYQFRDRNGLRFMVASGERDCVPLGLFLPNENRFLCGRQPANWWFGQHIPVDFWMLLYEHVLSNLAQIQGRRRRGAGSIVNVFMAPPLLHIGHYVWNDLTGQAALVRDLGADAPRSLLIAAADGRAEFFGAIDALFPAMAGKVDRSLPSKPAFIAHVYHSDIVPIRLTGSFIDAGLRDTIRRHIRNNGWADTVARAHAASGGGMVLIAGLRLEDRTFADSFQFYRGLIDHLDRTRPGTVIVLDGRNARPGGAPGEIIDSIKDHHSLRSPLQAEHDLVSRLQEHARTRRVVVASTVGLPVEASMAWCYLATACISPWGAGLAKYRWLANLPSVILTSRYNLLQRHDLDIYHSPAWMEAPAPMLLPDPERVVDRLDVSGNAPADSDAHGRECFEIDPDYAWSLLDRLLDGSPAA